MCAAELASTSGALLTWRTSSTSRAVPDRSSLVAFLRSPRPLWFVLDQGHVGGAPIPTPCGSMGRPTCTPPQRHVDTTPAIVVCAWFRRTASNTTSCCCRCRRRCCCCCSVLDDGWKPCLCASSPSMRMHPRATNSCMKRIVLRRSCIQLHNEPHVRRTLVVFLPLVFTCEPIPSIDESTCGHVRIRKPEVCVCTRAFDTCFEASVKTHEAPWKWTRANLCVEKRVAMWTRTKRTRTARWTKDGEDGAKRWKKKKDGSERCSDEG